MTAIRAATRHSNLATGKGAVQKADGSKSLVAGGGSSRSKGGTPKQDAVDTTKKVNK